MEEVGPSVTVDGVAASVEEEAASVVVVGAVDEGAGVVDVVVGSEQVSTSSSHVQLKGKIVVNHFKIADKVLYRMPYFFALRKFLIYMQSQGEDSQK